MNSMIKVKNKKIKPRISEESLAKFQLECIKNGIIATKNK